MKMDEDGVEKSKRDFDGTSVSLYDTSVFRSTAWWLTE